MSEDAFQRTDVSFRSGGVRCGAWLYRPSGPVRDAVPVVVMGHGFGGLRTFSLAPFAEHFVSRGLAVVVFDYRTFGGSDGSPRQLISPRRHVEDWAAAVYFARGLDGVDSRRVGLWGTSYSGGHVLVAAARDGGIAAVVSQVPYVKLATANLPPMSSFLRLGGAALRDMLRARAGRTPYRIGIVGSPGEEALLTYPGWREAYLDLVPEGSQWVNSTPARTVPEMIAYRPSSVVGDVRAPVLFLPARHDKGTPASLTKAVAAGMSRATVHELDCDHFDLYAGPHHEEAKKLAGDFLVEHLS